MLLDFVLAKRDIEIVFFDDERVKLLGEKLGIPPWLLPLQQPRRPADEAPSRVLRDRFPLLVGAPDDSSSPPVLTFTYVAFHPILPCLGRPSRGRFPAGNPLLRSPLA